MNETAVKDYLGLFQNIACNQRYKSPWTQDGRLFATDGALLVSVAYTDGSIPPDFDVPDVDKWIDANVPDDASDFQTIEVCKDCKGTGNAKDTSVECRECKGDGVTECPTCGQEESCRSCRGKGYTGDIIKCECPPSQRIFGKAFDRKYLAKIAPLNPEKRWLVGAALKFTFGDTGLGVLMSMRDEGDE